MEMAVRLTLVGYMELYNTLSKKEEEFTPLRHNRVHMYVCGITVYDYTHIGHARTYIFFDVLRRYLESKGYSVFYIQNITDVDDKIINRAKETKTTEKELAERFAKEMFADMGSLRIKRANLYPKATEHIDEMIQLVEKLIAKKHAYAAEGNVYFDVSSFKKYGKLSNLSKEELKSEEAGEGKKNVEDFALWKKQKPGEPAWKSPWGLGRPGWHIECSAMSQTYLGETIDIHGGARDLIFPHHENEIAQSEASTGKPFVRFWVHTGFLNVAGQKMSKSLGNFITIKDALKRWTPETLRFFFLSYDHQSPVDFSEGAMDEAKTALNGIQRCYDWVSNALKTAPEGSDKETEEKIAKLKQKFVEAMESNLNTREAIKQLFELCTVVEMHLKNPKKKTLMQIMEFFEYADDLFSILRKRGDDKTPALVELLLALRDEARKRKDFATSDKIRAELNKIGIEVQDTPEGQRWHSL